MISLVIPVRNRADIVGETLRSVDGQTRRPEQIILVDNGSTDSTLQTLREFAASRPWVTVVSEPTPGAAEARNRGLREVTEEYVMFFDSDDLMPTRHIEQICSELERLGRPDIGAFDMERLNLDGSVVSRKFRGGDLMFQHIFHCILSTQRYAVRTDFLREAGGWRENAPVWNDYLLGVALLCRSPRVEKLNLDEPVKVIARRESITGTGFAAKAGRWEAVLDRCSDELRAAGLDRYLRYIDYRRAILAGEYIREGRPDLAPPLTPRRLHRLIARYVAQGGRGVAHLARLLPQ